jgi:lipid A ethanolaminephosphotransferase
VLNFLKTRPTLGSATVIWLLTLYFATVLNARFWVYLAENLCLDSLGSVFFALSIPLVVVLPLYGIWNVILVPHVGKPLAILLLLISSAAAYAMSQFGVVIDSEMIRNVFQTDTNEALELVTPRALLWFGLVGFLPALLLARVRVQYASARREIARRALRIGASVLLAVLTALLFHEDYLVFVRAYPNTRRLINPLNWINYSVHYAIKCRKAYQAFIPLDPAARLSATAEKARRAGEQRVLVFILGETARTRNFSLGGYERLTNPLLAKQDVVFFDQTLACGTSTAVSVPCLFSPLGRKAFDVDKAAHTGNLLDLLAAVGYDVLWLENGGSCKGVCERVPFRTISREDDPRYCNDTRCFDAVLLDGLAQWLKGLEKSGRNGVIVLHGKGSHGPAYYSRYPAEFKRFTPACQNADIIDCPRQEVINAYDNSILYTDFVIASAIDMLRRRPKLCASLLYVSDHGESLGEDGDYLHGLPYALAPDEQKVVPMLFWLSEKARRSGRIDADCLKRAATEPHSHGNVFHSVLGLLGVESKTYEAGLDIFAACRR